MTVSKVFLPPNDKIATDNFRFDPKICKTPRKDLVATITSRSSGQGKEYLLLLQINAKLCKALRHMALTGKSWNMLSKNSIKQFLRNICRYCIAL